MQSTFSKYSSNNAVNGRIRGLTSGSQCSSINRGSIPFWWQVDLEALYDVKLVKIVNARDCCSKLKQSMKTFCLCILI